ncbi:hypothetical protein CHUAL_005316 [Chamberlinius hualienensis]
MSESNFLSYLNCTRAEPHENGTSGASSSSSAPNSDECNNTIIVTVDSSPPTINGEALATEKKLPLNQSEFFNAYDYNPPQKPTIAQHLKNACECSSLRLKKMVKKRLPILSWLPAYNFKQDIVSDIVAGITLAVVQIPQAMAFTMLSSASPVYGLYATFFSTALYFFLGTSKYSSLGMAGVTAMVVGKAMNERLERVHAIDEADLNSTLIGDFFQENSTVIDTDLVKQQVATTMALIIGMFQIVMGLLNLGCLSIFFSDVMMRACTMAAVLQMIIGQIPHLLGFTAHRPKGALSIIYNLIEIIHLIPSTNVATLITSVVCILFLVLVNEGINARYKHKLKIPIPTEIILIMGGIAVSHYAGLNVNYGVKVLNHIPTGFPKPAPPQLSLIPELLGDSIVVTILTFTIIMSQAKVLSSKYDCYPDISQELFANGVSNIVGSFFSSMPCSFAFVRCVLLIQLKARSLVCSIVCAITLLLVLLFIAPVFEPLPHSILAAILVVALGEILLDLKMIKTTWKSVKTDSLLIIASFLAVFCLDLQYGIAIGVTVSMIMVLFHTIRIKISTLGHVDGSDMYLEIKKYKKATEINGIKIFNIGGPLFFGTKDGLKKKIDKKVIRIIGQQKTRGDTSFQNSTLSLVDSDVISHRKKSVEVLQPPPAAVVILDFSSVTFLDTSALRTLSLINSDLSKVEGRLYIAAPKDKVRKTIERSEFGTKLNQLYPTIHDAVESARQLWITSLTLDKLSSNGYDNLGFNPN